jgi:glycosyltransferase involved in cell wall biosynthesis
MPLPVSVVVPHQKRRERWFLDRCMPSIRLNDPAEIIVEGWEGGACEKRNAGAAKATQPFLMCVDDDSVLLPDALSRLLGAMDGDPGASFAYSDTLMVLYPGVPYPNPAGVRRARPWCPEALKGGNYVETMSLVRRADFPGFDPALRRFQDWDLWLTMAALGRRGVYVPEVLFELHHFDLGISASEPFDGALAAIKRKHRLP